MEEGPARLADAVILSVRNSGMEGSSLSRLHEVCAAHRGDRNLFLRVQTPGQMVTVLRCGVDMCVKPDDAFVSEIETILGPGAVDVVGQRRAKPNRTPLPDDDESESAAELAEAMA